jgi:hypothetical protein
MLLLAENPELYNRSKHIAIKYYYIRQKVKKEQITLKYCQTNKMLANGLTKILRPIKHARFVDLL